MTDAPSDHEMIVDLLVDALDQTEHLGALDPPRAQAWASDLLALAAEGADEGERVLVELVAASTDDRALAVRAAIAGLRDDTSVCEGAWVLTSRGAVSVALRFVDSEEAGHVVSVDLLPALADGAERIGEVTLGPGDLLDVLLEEDAAIDADRITPAVAAERIAVALEATTRPTDSAVANGRLLVARLSRLVNRSLEAPRPAADEVPPMPERDPDEDAHALEIARRALGSPSPVAPGPLSHAARTLRAAATDDETVAQWLAASFGPVDLDSADLDVVAEALASTIVPATLEPMEQASRDAVLTLEWADWLGAVIECCRQGSGAAVGGDAMVDAVNRCPEVTSTIPKADRPRIAWAFDRCLLPWSELGLATDGRLTEFGADLLPHVLERAWAPRNG